MGTHKNKQGGFTLVEIAIVLVIIGLLLGGILKGQELIQSAKVRNLADQATGVQAAYYSFVDRFRQVPGDMLAANSCATIGPAVPGCPGGVGGAAGTGGNGQIDTGNFGEAAAAWAHLAAAGFLTGSYSGVAANAAAYQATPVAPQNAFGGWLLLSRSAAYQNVGAPTARLNLSMGRQIPVALARELDTKVDDGNPTLGVARSAPAPGGGAFAPVDEGGAAGAACVAAAAWDATTNQQDCNVTYLF